MQVRKSPEVDFTSICGVRRVYMSVAFRRTQKVAQAATAAQVLMTYGQMQGRYNSSEAHLCNQTAKGCAVPLNEEYVCWYWQHGGHFEVHHDVAAPRRADASKSSNAVKALSPLVFTKEKRGGDSTLPCARSKATREARPDSLRITKEQRYCYFSGASALKEKRV